MDTVTPGLTHPRDVRPGAVIGFHARINQRSRSFESYSTVYIAVATMSSSLGTLIGLRANLPDPLRMQRARAPLLDALVA